MVHHVTVVNSHMVSERYTCAENLSDKGTCGLQTVPHISAVKMCLWGGGQLCAFPLQQFILQLDES